MPIQKESHSVIVGKEDKEIKSIYENQTVSHKKGNPSQKEQEFLASRAFQEFEDKEYEQYKEEELDDLEELKQEDILDMEQEKELLKDVPGEIKKSVQKDSKKKKVKEEDVLLKMNEDERTTLRAGNSLHAYQSLGRPIDVLMKDIDQFETADERIQEDIAGEEDVFDIQLEEKIKDPIDSSQTGFLNDDIYQTKTEPELESDHFDYPSIGDDVFDNEKELTKKYVQN